MPEETFEQEDILVEQPEYVVPEGLLTLELKKAIGNLPAYQKLSEEEKAQGKRETPSCRLEFTVVDEGEFHNAWVSDIMGQTLSVGKRGPSNLRRYAEALLGRPLKTITGPDGKEKPEGVNLKKLIGRRVKVMVVLGEPNAKTKRRYGDIQTATLKPVGKPLE